jgi:hypothetical protein
MGKQNEPEICVTPEDYDESRVVFREPAINKFKLGDMEIEIHRSEARYLDDEGNECILYVAASPQTSFGVNANYKLGTLKADQSPDKIESFQMYYPFTSLGTVNSPTEAEQSSINMFESIERKGQEHCLKVYKKAKKVRDEDDEAAISIPDVCYANYMTAASGKNVNWKRCFKPLMSRPYIKGADNKKTKEVDMTKPFCFNPKLISSGKGLKIKCHTILYGPGDKPHNALHFQNVRGTLDPIFKIEGIYWGAHGNAAPYTTSLTVKLAQGNYTPAVDGNSAGPQKRFTRPNTAPVKEVDEDDDAPKVSTTDEDDSDDFAEPEVTKKNPAEELRKASTGKPTKKVLVKKTRKVPKKPVPTDDEED